MKSKNSIKKHHINPLKTKSLCHYYEEHLLRFLASVAFVLRFAASVAFLAMAAPMMRAQESTPPLCHNIGGCHTMRL